MDRRNFFKVAAAAVTVPALPDIPLEKPFDYSDLYMSREALEDIKNWNCDKIDDETKKEIYQTGFYGYSVLGFAVTDPKALDIMMRAEFE